MTTKNLGLDAIKDTDSSEVLGDPKGGGNKNPAGGDDISGNDDPLSKIPTGDDDKDEEDKSGDDEDKSGSDKDKPKDEDSDDDKSSDDNDDSDDGSDDKDSDKDVDEDDSSDDDGSDEDTSDENDENDDEGDDEDEKIVHSVAQNIKEELGVNIDEETTQNLTNDSDGIKELVKESAKDMMQKGVSNYFKQDPTLQKYKEFVIDNGGDPEDFRENFFEKKSWQNVEFSSENEAQQENIVREKLSRDGHSEDSINKLVSKYKDTGMLDTQAEMDLETIKGIEKQEEQEKIESQKEQEKMRQEEEKRVNQEIEDRIYNQGAVNGFKIDDPDGFHNYLYGVADKESGKSQYQLDLEQKSMDEQLSIPLMMYKNFNIQKEVEKKAKTKKAEDLNQKLNSANQKPKSKTNKRSNKGGLNELQNVSTSEVLR